MSIAYLNGEFLPLDQARVSPLDRGYLLGDGVYEVIPVYAGRLFRLEEHLDRLVNSLWAVRITEPLTRGEWREVLGELVSRNDGGHQSVYLQVTRGVAPRNHAFPQGVAPAVFAMTKPIDPAHEAVPATAVTRRDNRWDRCDIKAIALLANVLLRQEAVDAGATEAILLRDGQVTEGAASNVFVVREDFVVTPPKGPRILPGITRDLALELIAGSDLSAVEAAITEEELRGASEIWITSSTLEVAPVVSLDGKRVGPGRPGPVWERVYGMFRRYKERLVAGEVA